MIKNFQIQMINNRIYKNNNKIKKLNNIYNIDKIKNNKKKKF